MPPLSALFLSIYTSSINFIFTLLRHTPLLAILAKATTSGTTIQVSKKPLSKNWEGNSSFHSHFFLFRGRFGMIGRNCQCEHFHFLYQLESCRSWPAYSVAIYSLNQDPPSHFSLFFGRLLLTHFDLSCNLTVKLMQLMKKEG